MGKKVKRFGVMHLKEFIQTNHTIKMFTSVIYSVSGLNLNGS